MSPLVSAVRAAHRALNQSRPSDWPYPEILDAAQRLCAALRDMPNPSSSLQIATRFLGYAVEDAECTQEWVLLPRLTWALEITLCTLQKDLRRRGGKAA